MLSLKYTLAHTNRRAHSIAIHIVSCTIRDCQFKWLSGLSGVMLVIHYHGSQGIIVIQLDLHTISEMLVVRPHTYTQAHRHTHANKTSQRQQSNDFSREIKVTKKQHSLDVNCCCSFLETHTHIHAPTHTHLCTHTRITTSQYTLKDYQWYL